MEEYKEFKGINNPKVYEVFSKLDRSEFIDTPSKRYYNYDLPLSIGYGQTISQPSLVAQMIELLNVNSRHKVLEIGTGSGYQTAFLANLVSRVYTVEFIPELSESARLKLVNQGLKNINFKVGDGSYGWEEFAPYDRIIASAASREIPTPLLRQLAPEGRMVIPVGEKHDQNLILVTKDAEGNVSEDVIDKVVFVEFVGKFGWSDSNSS